jgi:hypothetical protein
MGNNISLEKLEEAQNLLLDAYNTMGSVTCNKFSSKIQLNLFLTSFNDIELFLEKMGVNLVY